MNWILKKIDHSATPQKAACLWNADLSSLKLISDGINVVYRFESNHHGFYLRLTHPSIRSEIALFGTIDYLNHLNREGAPVCKPVQSIHQNYIEQITQRDLVFFAHVTQEIPGKPIALSCLNETMAKKWGEALARLHAAAASYKPDTKFQFLNWKDLWQETADYIFQEEGAVKKEFELVDRWLHSFQYDTHNIGLTHGDHRAGNVLWDGKEMHVIDFDEPVYHWFLADIARPFVELFEQPIETWKKQFDAYIEGYRSFKTIDGYQLNHLTWFVRMKNLEMYLWSKNNWFEKDAPGGESRVVWLSNRLQMINFPPSGLL